MSVRSTLVLALLLGLGPSTWAQEPAAPLAALQDEAVDANPGLVALAAQQRALSRRAEVAGAWMDPMVALEYSNAPITSGWIGDHPMGGVQLKVQQTLRPSRWSEQSRAVLEHKADAAGHAEHEAALMLRARVAQTWWLLARTRMLEAVTEEHLARTEELLAAARARYETASVGQHAVLRLEVLRDRLADELGDFARMEQALEAGIAGALSREETESSFETPVDVGVLGAPAARDWLGLARAHRPQLARLAAEQEAAASRAVLARTEARVDPSVWAGYRLRTVQTEMDPGTDLVSIGVGVPIPLGSARRARGAEEAALEEAAGQEARTEALLDGIQADLAGVFAAWERAQAKAETYDEILLPGARAVLQTTQADFSVGRADFASLFEAEVALLDLERARIVALVDTHLHHAEATALLGTDPLGAP